MKHIITATATRQEQSRRGSPEEACPPSLLKWTKRWSRVAKSLGRLRMRALGSLAGFPMYVHYGHVSAIPT